MLNLFLRYGGDMRKPGPPGHPHPHTPLFEFTARLRPCEVGTKERREMVKMIKFIIEEGDDVNAANDQGITPFMNCAGAKELNLLKFLVGRGVDPKATRKDGTTALHMSAENGFIHICQYLVEECGLNIEATCVPVIIKFAL
jgi:ankyrin repeat protein